MTHPSGPFASGCVGDPLELVRAYEDVHGRRLPRQELIDRRICDLEREICRLPADGTCGNSSVLKALRMNPLLFASSVHTTLLLQSDDWDARQGASRMARYWQQRERMFGDNAFDIQVFKNPSRDDSLNYYDKCAKIIADTGDRGDGTSADDCESDAERTSEFESREVLREIASNYVQSVNDAKIAALNRVLDETVPAEKVAWTEARTRSPGLADSDEHKLMFLRCEDYEEEKAAARLCRYWKMKYQLFGPDVAHRPVRLDDLKDHEFELRLGAMRLMPGTDAAGRCIITNSMSQLSQRGWTIGGLSKVVWYVCHSAMERESCRTNGIVMFANHRGTSRQLFDDMSSYRLMAKGIVLDCLPVKVRAAHHFFDRSRWWQRSMVKIVSSLGKLFKKRTLVYLGRDEENLAKLQQFGIAMESVPSDLGGTVTFDDWNAWLNERSALGL